MKKDWQIKKLGDIFSMVRGPFGGSLKKECFKLNGYPVYEQQNAIYSKFEFRYFIDESKYQDMKRFTVYPGDFIMSCSGTIGKVAIVPETAPIGIINQALLKMTPKKNLYPNYAKYYLDSPFFEQCLMKDAQGAAIQNVASVKLLKEIEIPFPPLEKQKRIVAVLDKKFAQIETLKTAAEKNLQNTKQLFQAELEKAFSNTSWETQLFSDLFKLTSGVYLNSKSIIKGQYPIYGGNGIIAYHNEYNLTGDNIIIGRVGALCGNVRFLSKPIWLTDNAFKLSFLKDPFDYKFLTYLLNFKDLRKYARQAAQPVISNSSLKDIEIPLPPLEEQKRIVAHLDSLSEKVHQLEEIYTKQLADCDELKQSLLQKAFEGEL